MSKFAMTNGFEVISLRSVVKAQPARAQRRIDPRRSLKDLPGVRYTLYAVLWTAGVKDRKQAVLNAVLSV